RFNKKVQQAGILSEYRRREYFEKPSVKRKRKSATKRRKSLRSSQGAYFGKYSTAHNDNGFDAAR
ncbi:30S ribosomal protein S21, partial [Dehalococcoidia bacterium]|nr:30S ribosomal protein S21 [Dehalococcoidia bacterium]